MTLRDGIIIGIAGLIVATCLEGCRINHSVSGKVQTTNEAKVVIEVNFPLCADHPEWTFEQLMQCIETCKDYTVKVSTDEGLLQAIKTLQTNESATEPNNVQGGI